jgi:hypothetical protein
VGHLVYVRDAATAYRESVTLKDGQSLWGSGAVIQGRGNRFMGGVYPVLNSDGTGPAVILGNQTTIAGMGIVQAPSTSPQDGIYGRNVSGIVLRDNIVEGHGRMLSGIHLEGVSLPVFMATIRNNRISGAQGSGIEITLDDGGTTDLVLTGNKSIGNGVHGVSIVASLTDGGARIDLNSLVTSGNQAHGVSLDVNAFGGSVDVDIHNMAAEHNRYCGISGYLWGADGLTIAATGNSLGHNLDSGMMVEAYSGGSLASDFVSNDFSRNAYYGFVLSLNSGLGSTVTGRGNRFDDNGIQGFGLMSKSLAGTYDFGTEASPGLNRFSGNGQWQVVYSGMDVLSARGNWWGTPLPTQGVEYLSGGGGSIDASDPLPSPP